MLHCKLCETDGWKKYDGVPKKVNGRCERCGVGRLYSGTDEMTKETLRKHFEDEEKRRSSI